MIHALVDSRRGGGPSALCAGEGRSATVLGVTRAGFLEPVAILRVPEEVRRGDHASIARAISPWSYRLALVGWQPRKIRESRRQNEISRISQISDVIVRLDHRAAQGGRG